MAEVRIELNSAGVREMLRSPEMQAIVAEHAAEIASKAGSGYASDRKMMPGRAIASAYTANSAAMKDTLRNNTLLKAMEASKKR